MSMSFIPQDERLFKMTESTPIAPVATEDMVTTLTDAQYNKIIRALNAKLNHGIMMAKRKAKNRAKNKNARKERRKNRLRNG